METSMYKNRKEPSQQPQAGPTSTQRLAEKILTGDTKDILRDLRQQFGNSRTSMQMVCDSYMRLVTPKFAYNGRGERDLPVSWMPDQIAYQRNWNHCIKLDLSRLLVTYWHAVREGDNGPWLLAFEMWGRRLRLGIDTFVLAELGNGYVLMTVFDAKQAKQAREKARDARFENR